MNRDTMLKRAAAHPEAWDMVIVGGGATGVGVALDAASRGYNVLLVERSDFGKGTSSRSTKLIHGGVRYLEQGNISLVMEALRERGLLRQNAPHLVHDLAFVVPNYDWWEAPFYGLGLKLYDLLAGKYGFGQSRILSTDETLELLPTIKREGLRGGVVYYDGQFDDTRLLIHLAMTAAAQGATLLNYAAVVGFTRDGDGFLNGAMIRDMESGEEFHAGAKVVVNCTGAFADGVRRLADVEATPLLRPSQGIHLVFDKTFLAGRSAIMVPHTADGRVMFAIPWNDHTLVGTTDTPVPEAVPEPLAQEQEVQFILETAAQYLHHAPTRADVLSVFAGIRPLVGQSAASTASLSRDHTVNIDRTGLLSIVGGKWTTYRRMAEDAVNQAAMLARLPERACVTPSLPIHRYTHELPSSSKLDPALPYTEASIVRAAREEMARTVEDCLARRTRALFLNAKAAISMAPRVAALLAHELGQNDAWASEQVRQFNEVAHGYQL